MSVNCEDCGSKLYGGFCVNCDEEYFIAQQYEELDMPVPEVISTAAAAQARKREP